MSGDEDDTGGADGSREILAGEYVLGLLTAAEVLEARGLLAQDAAFSQHVADWEAKLAPLFDEIVPARPPERVWAAIAAAIAARTGDTPSEGEIVQLKRQVRQWRLGAGLATALAGALAVIGLQPRQLPAPVAPPAAPPPAAPPPLAAALAPKGGGSIGVVYRPGAPQLIALANDLKPRAGHDLELWVLPPEGAPLPLGLVAAGQSRKIALTAQARAKLAPGSTIAVSLEPVGGSPTGLPTGPVLAVTKIVPA